MLIKHYLIPTGIEPNKSKRSFGFRFFKVSIFVKWEIERLFILELFDETQTQ